MIAGGNKLITPGELFLGSIDKDYFSFLQGFTLVICSIPISLWL